MLSKQVEMSEVKFRVTWEKRLKENVLDFDHIIDKEIVAKYES